MYAPALTDGLDIDVTHARAHTPDVCNVQALKSSNSVRWNTLLKFKCRNRLLLTGTPIQNSMAELWSLLHFIMPSLFDTHSDFNEWFSKDIEKRAANKAAALDKEQLSRLHMILAPFMLRRCKSDVEHELLDKIEVQVDCSLSRRQRTIYDAIMRKISIDALIGASSASSSADKAVHGELMNLVMQFRKVCNHPDLFKRRDVHCPFIFEAARWNSSDRNSEMQQPPPKDGSAPYVRYMCSNPIVYELPRLVFREVVVRRTDHGSLDHVPWLCQANQFGVLTREHMHRSLFPPNDDSATVTHSSSLYVTACDREHTHTHTHAHAHTHTHADPPEPSAQGGRGRRRVHPPSHTSSPKASYATFVYIYILWSTVLAHAEVLDHRR